MPENTAPSPVVIHLGLHKTATTWLQDRILTNAADSPFHALKDYKDIIATLLLPEESEFDATVAQARFAPFLDDARSREKVAIVTSEELGSLPFHNRFGRSAFAHRVSDSFPDATVLVTIREQRAIIRSIYGQYVRYGYSASLEDFLREPPPESGFHSILDYTYYDYDHLLDYYESVFGQGRVVMAPFEVITKNPQWLTDQLGNALGRPIAAPNPSEGERRVNPAESPQSRWVTRHLNRLICRDHRWDRKKRWITPTAIGNRINRLVPEAAAKSAHQRDAERVAAAVGDRYAASNKRLAERLNLDLGALGYDVGETSL